ncbi:MAG: hypothetical protein ACKO23_02945, partial [Gemmataceae bacterium]
IKKQETERIMGLSRQVRMRCSKMVYPLIHAGQEGMNAGFLSSGDTTLFQDSEGWAGLAPCND